ncbi:MAG TPA: hypothetical protein VIJ31_10565 [Acidothermaceae bacterium]
MSDVRFKSAGEGSGIYRILLDGNEVGVVANLGNEWCARWSRGGQWMHWAWIAPSRAGAARGVLEIYGVTL